MTDSNWSPLESEVIEALREALASAESYSLGQESWDTIGLERFADIAVRRNGLLLLVEVRVSPPTTADRLEKLLRQLEVRRSMISDLIEEPFRIVLAIPVRLSLPNRFTISEAGFDLWDQDDLLSLLADVSGDHAQSLRRRLVRSALQDLSRTPLATRHLVEDLSARLQGLPCGRPTWSTYQQLCADILHLLFSPPLEVPIYESFNYTRINRRDIIMPNYSSSGFWLFMRQEYGAHHVVVDAKNYCKAVSKEAVLQLANYLVDHGAGRFGLILTRVGEGQSAFLTRREQWAIHRKMIVVLTDEDLLQMLLNKLDNRPTEQLLQQKIEDFRLSF